MTNPFQHFFPARPASASPASVHHICFIVSLLCTQNVITIFLTVIALLTFSLTVHRQVYILSTDCPWTHKLIIGHSWKKILQSVDSSMGRAINRHYQNVCFWTEYFEHEHIFLFKPWESYLIKNTDMLCQRNDVRYEKRGLCGMCEQLRSW